MASVDVHAVHDHFGLPRRNRIPSHSGQRSFNFPAPAASLDQRHTSNQAAQYQPGSWSTDQVHGKHLMSEEQRGGFIGSSTAGSDDARHPSSSQTLRQQQQNVHKHASAAVATPSQGANKSLPSLQLPPLLHTTQAIDFASQAPPRTSALPSILNPEGNESLSAPPTATRRRKFEEFDSPPLSDGALPPLVDRQHGTMHSPATMGRPNVPDFSGNTRTSTPRSPKRIMSNRLMYANPATGTISAQESPFPISPRTRSLASAAPGLAGSSSSGHPSYGSIAPAPSHAGRRRGSIGQNRQHKALSPSASPGTTYSGYSQAGRTPPATQYGNTPSTYSHTQNPSMSSVGTAKAYSRSGGVEHQRHMSIPISSTAGQNVYQMMTLETTSGTVQLPVDVQAASRVADDKRRRNAGASARFRQRRKEKERESSTTISRLEQRLKALSDDSDFYRKDRDLLASILMQVPGYERHFPRPQSPRHRRSSSIFAPGSGSGSGGYMSGPEQAQDRGRNTRRRTSTISLPPPPSASARLPGATMPPGQTMPPHQFGQYTGMTQPSQYPSTPNNYPSPMTRVSLPGTASLMASLPPTSQPYQQAQPQHLASQSQIGPQQPQQQRTQQQHPGLFHPMHAQSSESSTWNPYTNTPHCPIPGTSSNTTHVPRREHD